eukprot:COSAG01_NODE_1452_length_10260_cov_26.827970_13_plen_314_part_00
MEHPSLLPLRPSRPTQATCNPAAARQGPAAAASRGQRQRRSAGLQQPGRVKKVRTLRVCDWIEKGGLFATSICGANVCKWALCTTRAHNLFLVTLPYGVHTTCGCSGAVEHDHNGGLCIVLTCSWCVANFGYDENSLLSSEWFRSFKDNAQYLESVIIIPKTAEHFIAHVHPTIYTDANHIHGQVSCVIINRVAHDANRGIVHLAIMWYAGNECSKCHEMFNIAFVKKFLQFAEPPFVNITDNMKGARHCGTVQMRCHHFICTMPAVAAGGGSGSPPCRPGAGLRHPPPAALLAGSPRYVHLVRPIAAPREKF